ncbi:DUF1838 domain-containing protein [Parahaliea maris]|uniref:DUF1838 domain-containing protein n=1 Tax=Parahaliea maris TaxID=2716870 RepID=A0A5C8ZTZ8_9GAMM|nr:DUF1838 family protein [Parahaliea maris]TXS91968.1 DUF1838 domain-containing protein [Parahaliea maris]
MTVEIKRRTLLAGLGALGIGGITNARASIDMLGSTWLPWGETAPWRNLLRMQMSTAAEDILWWYTGRIYAQIGDSAPLHLFNLEGTESYYVRERDDGSFSVSSRTLTFFRDKDTGEMIREYQNPFTGKVNKVHANQLGGQDSNIFSEDGWRFVSPKRPDTKPEPWLIEWHRSGNLAWMSSNRFSKHPPQPLMESMTVFCPLDQLLDPDISSLPSHFTSTYLSPWQGWMDMGEREGHLVWHSSGRKLASLDEIPQEYQQRLKDDYKGAILTAGPDTWS